MNDLPARVHPSDPLAPVLAEMAARDARMEALVTKVYPEHLRLLGDALVERMALEMRDQVLQAETARHHAVWAAWASGAACAVTLVGGLLLSVSAGWIVAG